MKLSIFSNIYLLDRHPSWRLSGLDIFFAPLGLVAVEETTEDLGIFVWDLKASKGIDPPEQLDLLCQLVNQYRAFGQGASIMILLKSASAFSPLHLQDQFGKAASYHAKIDSILRNNFGEKPELRRIFIYDLDYLVLCAEGPSALSHRNRYACGCPFSLTGLKCLQNFIYKFCERLSAPRKKVLVLDGDNTLWGGVVGEDGLANLHIGSDGTGAAYLDFQAEILRLRDSGIILALCSKNNLQDVIEVLQSHQSMALRRSHFSIIKANWNEKYLNLVEIAEHLSLGLDSVVFWDDSPLEREKIRSLLPEVTVWEPPSDVSDWASDLRACELFQTPLLTEDDLKKSEQYESRGRFFDELSSAANVEMFMQSLQMDLQFHSIADWNLNRAEQLCQKTNQFNLTCIRYTAKDLMSYQAKNLNSVWLLTLKDKFGDHGIIGLIMISSQREKLVIDNLLLSCRALGRRLEHHILEWVVGEARRSGCSKIVGFYSASKRNNLVKDLYLNLGFTDYTTSKLHELVPFGTPEEQSISTYVLDPQRRD